MLGTVTNEFSLALQKNRLNARQVWDAEYDEVMSIPSSNRLSASHALRKAVSVTKLSGARALDLGCGNGRNSLFLHRLGFKVDALDFSSSALRLAKQNIKFHGSVEGANLILHDIADGLPYTDASFDFVLDAYCTCHLIDQRYYAAALNEIYRVVAPGGIHVRIHLDSEDRYYIERRCDEDDITALSVNKRNSIYKRHFSASQLQKQFSERGWQTDILRIGFDDIVDLEKYRRSVTVVICRKT